jgi:acetolactate synthase-1/2/3 large subunit
VAQGRRVTLAVGCRFSEVGTGSYGLEPPGPLIHVDIDPQVPGRNYPVQQAVTADAAAFIGGLLPLVTQRATDPALRRAIATGHEGVWKEWLSQQSERVTPPRLLRALQDIFGPQTIFTTDSGNGTFLAMECLRLERPGKFLAPVDYSCMGYAVPAAIGARLARPDCPVVALAGDGALLMTGLELLTAVQEGLGLAVLVLRDRELAQISQFQATALNRKTASELADYDAGGIAAALGVEALSLERDGDIPAVLRRVREITGAGRAVLVDVAIDYSRRTYFTAGVVKTNLLRLPWRDRLRFIGRALRRRVFG